jgi:hypothetical protein
MMFHDRLDRLVCLLVIVCVWCVLIGSQRSIRRNKYERLVRARFGLGLSLLTRAFCQSGTVFEEFVQLLLDAFSGRLSETVGYRRFDRNAGSDQTTQCCALSRVV